MPLTPQEKAEMNGGKGFAPKPKAESERGSGRVWADGFGQDADTAAKGQQSEQANPLVLAQLAGAAEQVALREARVQGGFEVTQAAARFIQGGGNLDAATALLQQINSEQRIPRTDLPLPEDTTLAILTLRSAIAELRQRALAAPGFFALEPDGMFSLAQSTSRTPYDDAIRAARSAPPALRPAFPSAQQQRQLGASQ